MRDDKHRQKTNKFINASSSLPQFAPIMIVNNNSNNNNNNTCQWTLFFLWCSMTGVAFDSSIIDFLFTSSSEHSSNTYYKMNMVLYCIQGNFRVTKFSRISCIWHIFALLWIFISWKCCHATAFFLSMWVNREIFEISIFAEN